jgi:DNA-binding FrmR family transcriptional regulator
VTSPQGAYQPRLKSLAYDRIATYSTFMSHTAQERQKLLARTRRIRGQIEAIERSLENEAGCGSVMHQIAACRGALAGLMVEVVEDHVRHHLVVPDENGGSLDPSGAEALVAVLRSYLK